MTFEEWLEQIENGDNPRLLTASLEHRVALRECWEVAYGEGYSQGVAEAQGG